MYYLEDHKSIFQKGVLHLLEIKDADIRLANLFQCKHAVDGSIHIGGASSATIPMVSLFYGGFLDINIEEPTALDQDMFVLSKGHAVATLASIYSDIGYFDKSILENSRSVKSILNGHPGPLLPGVHVATGPMGQGMGVAQGFAIVGQTTPKFDVYAITGDGELQEGPIWESVMYAGQKGLENFCVLVDYNGGQLDDASKLHFPYHNMAGNFESFGWNVGEVDATTYHSVYDALAKFKHGKRNGKPTAIICKTTKGHGGFSRFMNAHKWSKKDVVWEQETILQQDSRNKREAVFCKFYQQLSTDEENRKVVNSLADYASKIGYNIKSGRVGTLPQKVKTRKASIRDKSINYKNDLLPNLTKGEPYFAHKVIESSMSIFARDERMASIDSDLASTSGLQAGIGSIDKYRALNAGVAEANMVLIGEAFAIMGRNTWVSTFCPFFDWKLIRRIAVGYQERLEVIEDGGWLSEGHGIDLTLLATAADFDTQANGATHMGNDDVMMMDQAAYVRVINVSCPQQLVGILKWVVSGNKGILYLRILRGASPVIYDSNFRFEFGKAYALKETDSASAIIVASGRAVHEAIGAAEILKKKSIDVNVIDMPSIDADAIQNLYNSKIPVIIAEQNNGYLWSNFRKVLFEKQSKIDTSRLIPINACGAVGLHYIHSGTYGELASHYGLDADHLAQKVKEIVQTNKQNQ